MRPDGILLPYSVSFSVTGIENIHVIHITVSVTVIIFEINFPVKCLARIYDHLMRVGIFSISEIPTIITYIMRECYRTEHIKFRIEFSVRIIKKPVTGRTGTAICIESFLIQHLSEIGVRIYLVVWRFILGIEFYILKFRKYDKHFLFSGARERIIIKTRTACIHNTPCNESGSFAFKLETS
ncbi:hypothetical protein IMSAG025_02215 [Muribaculaceae bacterium]|nr:hypothetical protein IMSAG025_02215 [Muribaculaceae bacterium]